MFARLRVLTLLLLATAFAGGCATSNTPGDPFEGFNRAMFSVNEAIDNAILKPVATGYATVVPEPARDCVSNVFSNINDIFVGINSLLQGEIKDAASDVCRVLVNSTVGLLGCFDVASKIGLEKHNRDFGQTFGKWGFDAGPYLVLPLLGPSNIRDGIGLVIYSNLDPVWANHVPTRNVAYSLRAVNRRAELLNASNVLEDAALDKYSFVRDSYMQRRKGMIEEDRGASAKPGASIRPAPDAGVDVGTLSRLPADVWEAHPNQRGTADAPAARSVEMGAVQASRATSAAF